MCDEIRLALAEVRRRTPLAGLRGTPGDNIKAHRPWDRGRRSSSTSSSSGAVGSGKLAMHCLTAWKQWAVGTLQGTATLPRGSAQLKFCNALPQSPGAVGSGTCVMHCHTAQGQWAVDLVQCTASLPGGSGHCNSCGTPPHRLGEVDTVTPAMHSVPHRLGAAGSGTLAMQGPPTGRTGSSAQDSVAA